MIDCEWVYFSKRGMKLKNQNICRLIPSWRIDYPEKYLWKQHINLYPSFSKEIFQNHSSAIKTPECLKNVPWTDCRQSSYTRQWGSGALVLCLWVNLNESRMLGVINLQSWLDQCLMFNSHFKGCPWTEYAMCAKLTLHNQCDYSLMMSYMKI